MAEIDIHLNQAWAELKELHEQAKTDFAYAEDWLENNPSKMIQAKGRMERIRERLRTINRISGYLQLAADKAESIFGEGFSAGRKDIGKPPLRILSWMI